MIVTTVSRMLRDVPRPMLAASPFLAPGPMEAEPETKVIARESTTKERSGAGPSASLEALGVGKTVGRYELIHRLGHGGMAAVYLGRATGRAGFEKLVAVKVIHPHLAAEQEFVDMFLDEARIAARLHHPHVVEIHDLGDDDGVLFMVMEYVEGETLAALLRQLRKLGERLPLSAVLQVVADACEGLSAAHDLTDADGRPMHLVHRDVSPHNLLVSMDGRVKVVDFGIAKATGRRSSTRTGQLRGKLAYMSPEQAGGATIDHRTDLFALGAVLWELLVGERLFTAETESETLARVTACEVPDVRERRSGLPDGVAALVERSLARKPEARFATAQDMLREVRVQLRALEGDVDPRGDLAAVMSRLFEARVAYVRAAVRRAGESGTHRERAANDPVATDDATKAGERALDRASGSGAVVVRPSASSQPIVQGPGTNTHTLTALATAPARHWSLWLVLPLLGAVVGSAIVSRGFGLRDEMPAEERPRGTDPRPSLASNGDATPTVRTVQDASTIKWRFDTQPAGATVFLDGVPQPKTTPVTIEVQRGEQPIEVVLSREGYVDRKLSLEPLGPDNFSFALVSVPVPVEAEAGTKTGRRLPSLRLTARTKKPDGKGKPPETSDSGPSDPPPGRELPPQPDFGAIKVKDEVEPAPKP
jgi:serine/threonine protein kinase